jgi:hypothetical protein
MNPERWEKIKDLLGTALEVTPAERASYLDQSCGGDELLRHDVEVLLQGEPYVSSRFLNTESFAEAAATLFLDQPNPWIGRRVGPYQIVEQIGPAVWVRCTALSGRTISTQRSCSQSHSQWSRLRFGHKSFQE